MKFLFEEIKTGPYAHMTFADKFHLFYNKTNKEEECWNFTGGVYLNGYGKFRVVTKCILAHRVAYYLQHNHIDKRLVLHSCDNKLCVNPNHLRLGSQKDNMQDAKDRDRFKPCRGETSYRAKVTIEDIKRMFELRRTGMLIKEIAKEFTVTSNHVGRILSGVRWGHLKYGS